MGAVSYTISRLTHFSAFIVVYSKQYFGLILFTVAVKKSINKLTALQYNLEIGPSFQLFVLSIFLLLNSLIRKKKLLSPCDFSSTPSPGSSVLTLYCYPLFNLSGLEQHDITLLIVSSTIYK